MRPEHRDRGRALNDDRERREDEHADGDRAVAINHGDPIQQVDLAVNRIRPAAGRRRRPRRLYPTVGCRALLAAGYSFHCQLVPSELTSVVVAAFNTPVAAAADVIAIACAVVWPRSPPNGGSRNGSLTTADTASPALTLINWLAASTVSAGAEQFDDVAAGIDGAELKQARLVGALRADDPSEPGVAKPYGAVGQDAVG